MDIVDKKVRSRMMQGIKSKNTKPEIIVRALLHEQGFRFRLHDKSLPGTPDLVLRKYNAVIFVHGCYWHRHASCKLSSTPKQNSEFWQTKFDANIKRDNVVYYQLKQQNWRTAIVWECITRNKKDLPGNIEKLTQWLKYDCEYIEIPDSNMETPSLMPE